MNIISRTKKAYGLLKELKKQGWVPYAANIYAEQIRLQGWSNEKIILYLETKGYSKEIDLENKFVEYKNKKGSICITLT